MVAVTKRLVAKTGLLRQKRGCQEGRFAARILDSAFPPQLMHIPLSLDRDEKTRPLLLLIRWYASALVITQGNVSAVQDGGFWL